MENWIGIGIWVVMGGLAGMVMSFLVTPPRTTPGHISILVALGAFAAVVGGMLGVGIFSSNDPLAISLGGMGGALCLSLLFTFLYRWGIRALA